LVIHDGDETLANEIAGALPAALYACESAPSLGVGLAMVARAPFDVVVAGADDLALPARLKQARPGIPVVLVSSGGRARDIVEAVKRGASDYLVRPLGEAELRSAVDEALAAGPGSSGDAAAGPGSEPPEAPAGTELIGSGPAMSRLRETIRLVASSSAPALITGESGVGKELVACAVHAEGPRAGRPFVAVNTSAIPGELLEAELFGHARGGFTGAAQARKGLLTEASGGTVLLDEIGDMPLDLQAKMLRVLQSGEVRPVGSDRVHRVDVRIIAATHRDLPRMVREGQFREDLYFRLHVLPIAVPSLRERREDIPALVAHHLALAKARSPASPVREVAPEALALLIAAPWPGNIRELAGVVERFVVFGRDEVVQAHHLSFLQERAEPAPGAPAEDARTLRRMVQDHTERVLAETGGNKQRAAEILGVDLSTLYRWERARRGSEEIDVDLAPKSTSCRSRRSPGRSSGPVQPPRATGGAEPGVH
jgi:two-component system response regulator HydG